MRAFAGYTGKFAAAAIFLYALIASMAMPDAAPSQGPVVLLTIDGPIGPATSDYVFRGLNAARERGARAIVLRIDTPGGLDTSMREIIQAILSSPVPVIGYVAPSGARAASAGTYILYASHLAVMAPATNLGAATPVQIGGLPMPGRERAPVKDKKDKQDEESDTAKARPTIESKAIRDAAAYIRSLAQLRGRNADWAEKAVTEAATLSVKDALVEGVIDLIAENVEEVLAKADGRVVTLLGRDVVLRTAAASIVSVEPDWRTELLGVITKPTVAYILLLIGVYGLIFEFWSPGLAGPGVIGAICLLVALYALNQLPINYAGLALIVLGIMFIVAEAFVPAFGILGIGGIVALIVGSVMLIETDVPGFQVSPAVIAAVGGTSAVLFLGVLIMLSRSRRQPVLSGPEEIIGLKGQVVDWKGDEGRIRTHGEIWRATAAQQLLPGAPVRVIDRVGLTLVVQPME